MVFPTNRFTVQFKNYVRFFGEKFFFIIHLKGNVQHMLCATSMISQK